MNGNADERNHLDEILDRSKQLRKDGAALRERNAVVLEQTQQEQADRQRLRNDAAGVEEQREIERELKGLHDPRV